MNEKLIALANQHLQAIKGREKAESVIEDTLGAFVECGGHEGLARWNKKTSEKVLALCRESMPGLTWTLDEDGDPEVVDLDVGVMRVEGSETCWDFWKPDSDYEEVVDHPTPRQAIDALRDYLFDNNYRSSSKDIYAYNPGALKSVLVPARAWSPPALDELEIALQPMIDEIPDE